MDQFAISNLTLALSGRRVLVGITGSIAAYKCCELVRRLRDCGAEVQVVLTENAAKFVSPLTLETLSGRKVLSSLWESTEPGTHHISAARWAEVAILAPATANTIAKLACGIADDLLTTELLAFTGPVLVAPAMNPAMFQHPSVEMNLKTLTSRGVKLLGPALGVTACGEEGHGRMLEPSELLGHVALAFAPKLPRPASVLITLGPTEAFLDPVRKLTNRSSGRMGAALAWQFALAGYSVTVIRGACDPALPPTARVAFAPTVSRMLEAATELWPEHDVFIGAAAVLDWEPVSIHDQKQKKSELGPELSISLRETPDILRSIAQYKSPNQLVIGFAAETQDAVAYAQEKLLRKGCNAVFANLVGGPDQGFESLDNEGAWVSASDVIPWPKQTKARIARNIVEQVTRMRQRGVRAPLESGEPTHAPIH